MHETDEIPDDSRARIIDAAPVLDAPVLYHGQSLAEKTMERYGPSRGENPNQLPTRKDADGKLYPYDLANPDYTSSFEVGFRECFKCGETQEMSIVTIEI